MCPMTFKTNTLTYLEAAVVEITFCLKYYVVGFDLMTYKVEHRKSINPHSSLLKHYYSSYEVNVICKKM